MSHQSFDMIKGLPRAILQRMAQTKDPMLAPQALAALSWQNKIEQGQPQPQQSQQPTPVRDQVLSQSKLLQNMQQRGAQGIQQLQQGAAQQPMAAGPQTPQPAAQADPYAQGLGAMPMQFARGGIVAFAGGDKIPGAGYTAPETDEEKAKRLADTPEGRQKAEDRQALAEVLSKLGAAGQDIIQMPFRAASGVANTGIVRPLRALTGADIPYFPMMGGGDGSSMTPNYDALRAAKPPMGASVEGGRGVVNPPLANPNAPSPQGVPVSLSTAGPAAPRANRPVAGIPAVANGMSVKDVQEWLKPFANDAGRLINEKPEVFDQTKVFESQEALRRLAGIVGDPYAAQRQRLLDADRQFKDTRPELDKMGLGGIYQYLKGAARPTGQTSMGASVLSGLDAMDSYKAAQRAEQLKQTGELNKGLGALDDSGLGWNSKKVDSVEAIAKAKALADAQLRQQQVQSAGQMGGHAITGIFTSADQQMQRETQMAIERMKEAAAAARAAGNEKQANTLMLNSLKLQVTSADRSYQALAKEPMADPKELAAAKTKRDDAYNGLLAFQQSLGMVDATTPAPGPVSSGGWGKAVVK